MLATNLSTMKGHRSAGEFDELDEVLKTEVVRITAESTGQVRAVRVSSAPPIESVRAQAEFEGMIKTSRWIRGTPTPNISVK